MIKNFIVKTASNNYGSFGHLNGEIMKFLMQKYYKNISFEELDGAIKEKYVEYFI